MQRVPLAPAHVEALRAVGTTAHFAAAEFLARASEPADRFIYVEAGEVEVVDPISGERWVPSTLDLTQFMGEVALLSGGNWSTPMGAARPTAALVVPRPALLKLMSEMPELSDIVIIVPAARRRQAGLGALMVPSWPRRTTASR